MPKIDAVARDPRERSAWMAQTPMEAPVRRRLRVGRLALMALACLWLVLLGIAGAQADNHSDTQPPLYLDASQPVEARVEDLLARMTLPEKIGQMTQINLSRLMGSGEWDRGPLSEAWLQRTLVDAHVGSLLSGGGAAPVPNEPQAWLDTVAAVQRFATENTRLGIPLLYGVDAVHGHNNVLGATIYPHNLGLAAGFDPELVADVAVATSTDVAATGITWNFAPVADLGRDPRWGRFYETFGENPAVVATLVAAYVEGQQRVPSVAGTLKHFVGYGQAESGLDRAPAAMSLRELRGMHLPPFVAGLRAGAPTVMINSGSVNGVPVHASRYLLTEVLRGELGFSGIALSDWNDIDKLFTVHGVAADLGEAIVMAISAGVDVVMVPHDAAGFTAALRAQVEAGAVSLERIDEAVRRVLTLKFALGLFEQAVPTAAAPASVVETDRSLAHRAALAGLTLLENRNGTLPLTGPLTVLVTGPGAFDVPMQLGGWTIGWQGLEPNARDMPPAVTVLEALQVTAPEGVDVRFHDFTAGDLADAARAADAVVLVLAEPPYAETPGDDPELRLPEAQYELAQRLDAALEGTDTRLVGVLLTGRPVMLPDAVESADALLMAYLPGSEGGSAIADVLFGRSSPAGRLPFTWPASAAQVPIAADEPPMEAQREPLYPLGHGLSYARFRYSDLRAEPTPSGVQITITVENPSDVPSDHVVLAWASYPVAMVTRPERELVGFARTRVAAGAAQEVSFVVPWARLTVIPGDVVGDATPVVPAGRYVFSVGNATTSVTLHERSVPFAVDGVDGGAR